MANFEHIKDIVLEYADAYAKSFAVEAYATFPRGTGQLAKSYRGVAKLQDNKFSIEIYGEAYGIYQDSGVNGINKTYPRNSRSFYAPGQFKEVYSTSSKRIAPIGGNLPIGQRYVIRYNGLRPRPFMQDAVDAVTPQFVAALQKAGAQDIEDMFKTLNKIQVTK